uniref:histidine kinase n=1 Tax=Cyanothece sp. (strain PCC 7425 / ATCC 29141) TaxID=395961 RepID=B8HS57_CYAP4
MPETTPPSLATTAALPANEPDRLAALQRYHILDTPPEQAFDRITALAARLFGVPIVLVSLVDETRAWFKSCYGFNQQEVARDATICSFTLLHDDVFVVPDARQDDRFACNPLVKAEPGLRFYAGAPLLTADGFNLGTLCLLDTQPRDSLTAEQRATLTDLAAMVMDELELRLAARKIAQVDAALLEVSRGVATVTGQAFFDALVQHIAKALGMNYACISLLTSQTPAALRTIAFYAQGKIVDNVEYELEGTPCLNVIRQQKLSCYASGIQALFPDDRFLVALAIESYASIPFFDSQGQLLGILGVMDNQPIANVHLVESLLTLFAMRIGAEVERQQAEELQQAAAQRLQIYSDVVGNAQVGMVVWQLEDWQDPGSFRLLLANPAASAATGFDFEPVIGRTMAESFPHLLQTPLVQHYLDVVHTGRSLDLGEVSYSEDGIATGIYSLKAFPLPGHCLGLAFENITPRKQIESQLQESQRFNQQIAEAMPGVVFVHDLVEQRNVYTNRQITDFLGYTSEQVQAMGANAIATLIHPDDLEQILSYFAAFQHAADDVVLGIEYRAHHANGEWRWMYSQSVVFNRTVDGIPRQLLGVAIDITDRKRSEQALQESEAWTRLAAQVAQLGGWRLHLETNLVEIDQRMGQIWGEPENTVLLPLPIVLERIHPADRERVTHAVTAALDPQSLGVYETEYRIVWKDGSERWVLAKGQARFEGEGTARRTVDFFGTALDITDRKQAEAALAAQEQRYRYIFESVSVAIWEEDFSAVKAAINQLQGSGIEDFAQYLAEHPEFVRQMASSVRIHDVNQAALQMFGAKDKAELLSSLNQIFVPETEAAFIGELLAIAEGKTYFAAETVVQTLQGERLRVWFTITFPSASQPYDHVLVSLLDITQRKQVEAALQASEERYRHLAEAMPQIVWTTDAQGLATYFNPNWYGYTGLTAAESMGLESPNALHPEDRDRVLQQWLQAVEAGTSYEIEIRLRRWDGVYRWFLCRGLPVRDPRGEIISWVGTNTDIDDQKHIQAALHQSEERLSLALRSAQAGMWQWLKAENRMIWSDETFRMLGYEPGQCSASHQAWVQVVHPDDRAIAEQAVQRSLAENCPLYSEYRVCLPDGSIRWLADIGQVTYDEAGDQTGTIGIQIDISQRKQSELERERSEAILNAFLTASPIALTLLDRDLRFIYANEALAAVNGLPLSEHLGRTLEEVVPTMAPQFGPMLRQIIATQTPVLNLEFSGEVQPGLYRQTIANHFPVCLPDGEVLGVGVTVTDISELKRVEAELRQSEERLSLALKAANQGLYDLNLQTGQAIVSPEYARMLGYEPEELEETTARLRDRLHPDDLATVDRVYQEYVANLHTEYRVEFRQRTITGGWVWILSIGKIVNWDQDGNPLRMLGTHTDISDRKQAEQALQQHSERLNLLYQTTRELLSAKQPLDLMNQLFERLSAQMQLHYYYHFKLCMREGRQQLRLMNYSGLSVEQAEEFAWIELGQSMCGLVAQERRQIVLNQTDIAAHANAHKICLMGVSAYVGHPLIVNGQLLGTLSFASLTRTQFTPAEVNLLQAISEQVAIALERAELVASLEQQTEDLARANRVKDEFLAVLSHELRSPLNPILGWTKLLQSQSFSPDKAAKALATIERNAKLQAQLIEDLLDVSRILQGKMVLNVTSVNLGSVIEAALETVRLAAEAKAIQLETLMEPEIDPILGDPARLQQIVWNLLTNAVKFTPQGGQVTVRLQRVDTFAQLQVQDTGKGISPAFLPHVFDYFRQEDGTTTRKFGGLGLGLAIVRHLTEQHGGTVAADSPGEGLGATFTIRLPLQAKATETADPQLPPAAQLDLSNLNILVVDDEVDMRELMVTILETYGAQVRLAASAIDALNILQQWHPDLLISDIGMPDMDGYSLMQQVQAIATAQQNSIPGIALTAYAGEIDQRQALAAGYQLHLAKPVEPEALVQAIATLIPASQAASAP